MKESKRISELKALIEENGGDVSPEAVVDAARDPKSALHSAFCWDDTEAARLYRVEQARRLLRVAVVMIARPGSGETVRVRAFIAPGDGGNEARNYQYVPDMLATKTGRSAILATALAEFDSFKTKYEWLAELVPLFEARKKIA